MSTVAWRGTLIVALAVFVAACGASDTAGPSTEAATGPTPSSSIAAPSTASSAPTTTATEDPAQSEPESTSTSTTVDVATAEVSADAVIAVSVIDGAPVEDLRRVEVAVNETVELTVTSDAPDEVHVHGFDVFGAVAPGAPAVLEFTADIPGIFEVELEGSHVLLFELQVNG